MITCKRCVMDETMPDFRETISGCVFCDAYFRYKGHNFQIEEKTFKQVADNIRVETCDQNRKYDAVMGISGGIDSSTALYLAYHAGMNVLVLHADNHYNKAVTDKNIKALLKYTKFDFKRITIDFDDFVAIQHAVIYSGVINIEVISDLLIQTTIYRTAHKLKIPYVLDGSNITTEALRCAKIGYKNDDKQNLKNIWRKFGNKSKAFKKLNLMNVWEKKKLLNKITIIRPLNYFDYNPETMKSILIKDVVGYADYGGKHEESYITDFYQRYILPEKFGIDKRKVFLSNRVCAGHMTREEALEKLTEPFYQKESLELGIQLQFIAKLFKVSTAKLVKLIHETKPTSHETYGTDKVLRFLANVRFRWKDGLKKVLK